jgi:multisubunit Na+/H+ antiporter MnhB subunit
LKARIAASALAVGVLAALLARAAYELRAAGGGLGAAVSAQLAASGVAHPVTAVLLNFRSYDTWLELIILLLAAAGALQGRLQSAPAPGGLAGDPLLAWLVTALVPLMMLAAGYLLQAGADAPGGAFQAGALLGAALVLLHFAGRNALSLLPAALVRVLLVLGAAFFAIAGVAGLALENALLQYPPQHAHAAILAIEAAATASITVALAALVIGQMDG